MNDEHLFLEEFVVKGVVKMVITSEKNSYGLADEKWLDGKVDFKSSTEHFLHQSVIFGETLELEIVGVTEINNMPFTCTHESYYECLGKRFVEINRSALNSKISNTSFCAPFSLPLDGEEIQICTQDGERKFYENVIWELEADQQTQCKISCNIKEFSVQQGKSSIYTDPTQRTAGFRYKFVLPKATKDLRSKKPFKRIKTQYLMTSMMTLVGNVGGTLGLFIGFSFLEISEWITDFVIARTKKD